MKTKSTIPAPPQPEADPSAAAHSLAARLGWNTPDGSPPAVVLTDKALAALRQLDLPVEAILRIGVIPGGCSGHTYSAAVDTHADPADLLLHESNGLRIVTDPQSAAYLDGLQIDYSDDLIESGFRFRNPTAGSSCGCGASFKANP